MQDTGSGMDAATQARAFEPLFTTKPIGQGTGLGLASVLSTIQMSGGHVTLHSEVGRGTRITLWLPIADAAIAQQVTTARPVLPSLAGLTVLVAEDSAGVLRLVHEVLTEAGCTVLQASDTTQALAHVRSHTAIDVLCTDVVMPGPPVRDLLEQFSQSHPSAGVLILSGYVGDDLARRGIEDGRYQLLPKPFGTEQLTLAINAICHRGTSLSGTV
jgi:CheY-like chemotaxis protein